MLGRFGEENKNSMRGPSSECKSSWKNAHKCRIRCGQEASKPSPRRPDGFTSDLSKQTTQISGLPEGLYIPLDSRGPWFQLANRFHLFWLVCHAVPEVMRAFCKTFFFPPFVMP